MKRGMTLVEVLVSMGLLTVVVVLVLSLLPRTLMEQRQLTTRSLVIDKAEHDLAAALSSKPALSEGDHPLPTLKLPDGTEVAGTLQIQKTEKPGIRSYQVVLRWKERGLDLEYQQKQKRADLEN